MEMIPPRAEEEEAYIWGMGAKKYGRDNWKKGIPLSEIVGAIHRHLNKIKRGELFDKESGRQHAGHIRCDAAMLIEFIQTRPDLNDL